MPLENDFTRVFGAIKELEARVERMEKNFEGPDGQPYIPIPRPSTTAWATSPVLHQPETQSPPV
jgi:hypothetical protein